jgi:hypothetical protein
MNETTFIAGDRCGAYTIVRLIGRGRTAEVYEAAPSVTSEAAEPSVAIRCLKPEHAGRARLIRRMLEERAILADAKHTNVAAVLGEGEHRGAPFTVLEFVPGRTLRERLDAERAPLTLPVALCFVRQIADGAAAIHAAGAAHGDLRPESILLTDIDEVKLCDLGPSVPICAPDPGNVSADIRAVGLILAEMLAGRRLDAASLGEALAEAPAYARELIEKAVLADPGSGFASMTDFSDAVNEAWNQLLQDNRAGVELRKALDMLAGVIEAINGAPSERGAAVPAAPAVTAAMKAAKDAMAATTLPAAPPSDDDEEEDEDTDVDIRRDALLGLDDGPTVIDDETDELVRHASNDLAALLKGVLDAAQDLALDATEEPPPASGATSGPASGSTSGPASGPTSAQSVKAKRG